MSVWQSIETAPKDGTLVYGKEEDFSIPRLALYRCVFKEGEWRHLEYKHVVRPTHWKPMEPKQ